MAVAVVASSCQKDLGGSPDSPVVPGASRRFRLENDPERDRFGVDACRGRRDATLCRDPHLLLADPFGGESGGPGRGEIRYAFPVGVHTERRDRKPLCPDHPARRHEVGEDGRGARHGSRDGRFDEGCRCAEDASGGERPGREFDARLSENGGARCGVVRFQSRDHCDRERQELPAGSQLGFLRRSRIPDPCRGGGCGQIGSQRRVQPLSGPDPLCRRQTDAFVAQHRTGQTGCIAGRRGEDRDPENSAFRRRRGCGLRLCRWQAVRRETQCQRQMHRKQRYVDGRWQPRHE